MFYRHLKVFVRKNLILIKRAPMTTFAELLLPVVLMVGLAMMRYLLVDQPLPKIEFPDVVPDPRMDKFNFYSIIHYPLVDFDRKDIKYERKWMEDNYAFGGVIPRSYKFFMPKSCFWTGNEASQRQMVGLAPMNKHTRFIAR